MDGIISCNNNFKCTHVNKQNIIIIVTDVSYYFQYDAYKYISSTIAAVDLTYGSVYCFSCKDYVYDEEFDDIVKKGRDVASLAKG